ncbi:hypothetical protein [Paenibacillus ferrarius]|uniref:hypothetical protein n=1 Tax=Paenibacillus ferrarius TaxID=1469647 RepID=UPI00117C9466|nr:hypothetical protein [Paenibacillus ferrarius]
MPKTTYWVSVGRQEVVPAGEAVIRENYEFEIRAEEAGHLQLQEQFQAMKLVDKQLINRARTPYFTVRSEIESSLISGLPLRSTTPS